MNKVSAWIQSTFGPKNYSADYTCSEPFKVSVVDFSSLQTLRKMYGWSAPVRGFVDFDRRTIYVAKGDTWALGHEVEHLLGIRKAE